MIQPKIPVPVIDGEYRHIFEPRPDIYKGVDTPHFKYGEFYEHWIPNDFTFIKDGNGIYHFYGITHPKPPTFKDCFDFDELSVHEAENQLFHAIYKGEIADLYESGVLEEKDKILYPSQRPGEVLECWAPCIIQHDDLYYIFYSPSSMRYATSSDLYHFTPQGTLFDGQYYMRDPYIIKENNLYYMIYNENEDLYYRTSCNLVRWSDKKMFWKNHFRATEASNNNFIGLCAESPCIFKREDYYYLFFSTYDGQNGCYDNRTFVFASESLEGFNGKAPITMLKAHASEVICENGQFYILSIYYPNNGISIAKLRFEYLM